MCIIAQSKLISWSRCGVRDEACSRQHWWCWNCIVLFNANLFYFLVLVREASNKETCEHNHRQCSRHAFCTDYATGFCCHCQSSFFGNGKHCLPAGEACWLRCWGCSACVSAAGLFLAATMSSAYRPCVSTTWIKALATCRCSINVWGMNMFGLISQFED